MRILEKPQHWWKGLLACCQFCCCTVEFEGLDDEVRVHEQGDFKDESTLTWVCVNCKNTTFDSYSRMNEESKRNKKRREDRHRIAHPPIITG